jgi:glycosyltransferase involved in cell wall biosynthesis
LSKSEVKVSAIIPTFNSANYLRDAINSALDQTYSALEVIVIDDGSTDETVSVIKSFADRVIYIRQEQSGPSSARNRGIATATGEYVAFLDADDIWLPSKLEKQLHALQQEPEAGLVYSRSVDFDDSTGEELRFYPKEMHSGMLFDLLLIAPLLLLSSVVVRTRVLKELGGFDEGLRTAEDTHLYLRIAQNYRIIGVPDILVKRRIHDRNLSNRMDIAIGTLSCLDRIVRLFPETNPRIYPAMAMAYRNRGKAMMLDCFHSGAYAVSNRTACHLLRLGIWDCRIMCYFLLTLFPMPLISLGRSIRKRPSKA